MSEKQTYKTTTVLSLEDRARRVLTEKVNPLLGEHSGGAELLNVEDGVARVRMTGACSSCPSARFTLEEVVKAALCEELPEIEDVVLDTSVSEDLLDFARKLLNHEIVP
ncbi:MAG TPA: NifU family protein [Clostridiales bacterium]|jgi:Fe-S cluster biogenesis protein NfuA|nr:NifU family protein [Clostridiales bacterium]